ncbi:GntR domain protein [Methylobacterium sp. 4-46]|uniref:FadR/GntR family transcriptional regulator n=1 Tax=unclassified Methylobacterium TaxID=2615210 RepID=UPI000152D079|nr:MULTISPECIES: FadR/GntR family transcriptional regulator [Methylobacterium]ACA17534.1 GntR domain protein [Methylobacterium sp. 4-46]WFT83214.1 FadR/GntR family transcriptional regulator [Methylobacterium nodulans]
MEIARPNEGRSGFEVVFAFLRERLLAGALRPGDRLIPERELAAQLGVSRPIVREALRALTALGIVEIRERMGTIVRKPDVTVLNDFFAFALAQQDGLADDVMQARIAVECQSIRLACQNATVSDLERLQRALQRIVETIDDPEAGGAADYAFHRAIVAAGGSSTLGVLHDSMAHVLMRSHVDRRRLVQVVEPMRSYLIEDHRRIFDAIAARDPARADAVLREHFAIGDGLRRQAALAASAHVSAARAG